MDRPQLLSLLPHQGPALWLDALLDHDAASIRGLSAWAHLANLGHDASPILLYEAAAQLCAAHGALYGQGKSIRLALVAKLSSVQLHATPTVREGSLQVSAQQQTVGPSGALYGFAIHQDDDSLLLDGRLLLVLTDA